MIRITRYFLLFFFLPVNSVGQSNTTKIDSVINAQFFQKNFNGNAEVIKDGKVIYKKSLGTADFAKHTPLKENSVFYLGSMSKQFTAMCIMILKSRGQLNYDDLVIKYIPKFPFPNISIRHLLTHSSGINDYINLNYEQWQKYHNATDKDVIKIIKENYDTLKFQPGSAFFYSNSNYAILVNIIEIISKSTYPDFIRKNIFRSLNMKESFIKIEKRAFQKGVKGYIKNDSLTSYELPDSLNSLFGSPTAKIIGGGGIFSTLSDLYKWDQALYTNKLVSNTIINEAFTPYTFNNGTESKYGFGWNIYHRNNGDTVVRHAGQFTGYLSIITRNITRRETIILLTNLTGKEDISNLVTLMTQIENILESKEQNSR